MTKNERAEVMANEIYETLMLEADVPLSGMDCSIIADLLVGKGWVKASDIANEFFEALKNTLDDIPWSVIELIRKYTVEERK